MLRLASAHGTNATISRVPMTIGTSTLAAIAVPSSGIEPDAVEEGGEPGESRSMPRKSKVSDGSTSSWGSTTWA